MIPFSALHSHRSSRGIGGAFDIGNATVIGSSMFAILLKASSNWRARPFCMLSNSIHWSGYSDSPSCLAEPPISMWAPTNHAWTKVLLLDSNEGFITPNLGYSISGVMALRSSCNASAWRKCIMELLNDISKIELSSTALTVSNTPMKRNFGAGREFAAKWWWILILISEGPVVETCTEHVPDLRVLFRGLTTVSSICRLWVHLWSRYWILVCLRNGATEAHEVSLQQREPPKHHDWIQKAKPHLRLPRVRSSVRRHLGFEWDNLGQRYQLEIAQSTSHHLLSLNLDIKGCEGQHTSQTHTMRIHQRRDLLSDFHYLPRKYCFSWKNGAPVHESSHRPVFMLANIRYMFVWLPWGPFGPSGSHHVPSTPWLVNIVISSHLPQSPCELDVGPGVFHLQITSRLGILSTIDAIMVSIPVLQCPTKIIDSDFADESPSSKQK